jgi:hypothetical protein
MSHHQIIVFLIADMTTIQISLHYDRIIQRNRYRHACITSDHNHCMHACGVMHIICHTDSVDCLYDQDQPQVQMVMYHSLLMCVLIDEHAYC